MSHGLLFSFKVTLNNTSHQLITLQWKKTLPSHVVRTWILVDKFNGFLDDVLPHSPWVCFGLVFKHRQCSTASKQAPGYFAFRMSSIS